MAALPWVTKEDDGFLHCGFGLVSIPSRMAAAPTCPNSGQGLFPGGAGGEKRPRQDAGVLQELMTCSHAWSSSSPCNVPGGTGEWPVPPDASAESCQDGKDNWQTLGSPFSQLPPAGQSAPFGTPHSQGMNDPWLGLADQKRTFYRTPCFMTNLGLCFFSLV